MPLLINLRRLQKGDLSLKGELPLAELELDGVDELIHPAGPLRHELVAQALDEAVLVQGRLELPLQCECARCLRPFASPLILGEWTCHLPLSGEDRVPTRNDCVDLTPYVREDILLAFPQHPLCEPECRGLLATPREVPDPAPPPELGVSAWAELNKLKL